MNNDSRNIVILTIICLIAIDQITKYIIRIKGGFYICNKGIAFGLGSNWAIIFFLIVTAAIFFISQITNSPNCLMSNKISKLKYQNNTFCIGHFIRNWKLDIRNCKGIFLPLILILAGGISNLIDRITYDCVIDFIDIKIWPVFNLADVYITIGGIILMLKVISKK